MMDAAAVPPAVGSPEEVIAKTYHEARLATWRERINEPDAQLDRIPEFEQRLGVSILSALRDAGFLVIGPDAETRERMEEAGAAVWVREHEERFGRAVTNPSYRAFVLSRFALALTAALAASLEEQ